jgi:hypothetical protein
LWVNLFKDKYLKGHLPFTVSVVGGSLIWNSVVKAIRMLEDGFIFKIGDGNSSFWYDSWIVKEKLSSLVPFVAIQDTQLRITDVWFDGKWNFQHLYTCLPEAMVNNIKSLQPRIVNGLPDVWTWHHSSSGVYSTKDAYSWFLNPLSTDNHLNWQWIWRLKLPASIQFFIWQVLHRSIPTKEVLYHRRVCNSNLCPRCLVAVESIDHCLFLCTDAVRVWRACGLPQIPNSTQGIDSFEW